MHEENIFSHDACNWLDDFLFCGHQKQLTSEKVSSIVACSATPLSD
jgi:hypothetical protein